MLETRTFVSFFLVFVNLALSLLLKHLCLYKLPTKPNVRHTLIAFACEHNHFQAHLISSVFRENALLTTLLPSNFSPFYATKRDREPRSFPKDVCHPSHLHLTDTHQTCMHGLQWHLTLLPLQVLKSHLTGICCVLWFPHTHPVARQTLY